MLRWRFRVLPVAVLPDGFWSPDADFEKFHFFPNLGLKSGAWKFEKKVSMPFWSEYEGELPCDDGSQNYEKTLSFLDFLIKTCCFT